MQTVSNVWESSCADLLVGRSRYTGYLSSTSNVLSNPLYYIKNSVYVNVINLIKASSNSWLSDENKFLLFQFKNTASPLSEIAPPKPPRPSPQAHQPAPELPQKTIMRKKSADVHQRSSTESSGSDGTEQAEQVITDRCQSATCSVRI